jgi:hypothetical protein
MQLFDETSKYLQYFQHKYLNCSTANELLRLLASLPQMRAVLQALFHKMLLFPPIHKRATVVKTLATKVSVLLVGTTIIENMLQILNKPARVVDIISDGVSNGDDQFALWRM